jgi:hypothetical protein
MNSSNHTTYVVYLYYERGKNDGNQLHQRDICMRTENFLAFTDSFFWILPPHLIKLKTSGIEMGWAAVPRMQLLHLDQE